MRKKYLLFSGQDYYPHGGADDLVRDMRKFPSVLDATDYFHMRKLDDYSYWAHVLDLDTLKIVKRWNIYIGWTDE